MAFSAEGAIVSPPDKGGQGGAFRIGIIGAGFTGLAAAYCCARMGCDVTLIEGGETAGGLAGGFTMNGFSIEKAYHHLFPTDRHIIGLFEELNIGERLKWYESSVFVHENGRFQPFLKPLDLLRFSGLNFPAKIRLGLTYLYLQNCGHKPAFNQISAVDWLKKNCGKAAYQTIWEPLLRGKFHQYADQIPMAWLWARINQRASAKQNGREMLGYPDGGFQTLVDALTNKITVLGGKIHLKTRIQTLEFHENAFHLTAANGEKFAFDRLLCAIPAAALLKLMPSLGEMPYFQRFAAIPYLGAVLVLFRSRQSLLPGYWHNIHDPQAPFLALLQHTNLTGTAPYGGDHLYYLGAYCPHDHLNFAENESAVEKRYLDYFQKICPNFDRNQARDVTVVRLANAQHVPSLNYLPLEQTTPVPNLYVANFAQIYPQDRSTNSAVEEGLKAADSLTAY